MFARTWDHENSPNSFGISDARTRRSTLLAFGQHALEIYQHDAMRQGTCLIKHVTHAYLRCSFSYIEH